MQYNSHLQMGRGVTVVLAECSSANEIWAAALPNSTRHQLSPALVIDHVLTPYIPNSVSS